MKFRKIMGDIAFIITILSVIGWVLIIWGTLPGKVVITWIVLNVVGFILSLLAIGTPRPFRYITTFFVTLITLILIGIGEYISRLGGL